MIHLRFVPNRGFLFPKATVSHRGIRHVVRLIGVCVVRAED